MCADRSGCAFKDGVHWMESLQRVKAGILTGFAERVSLYVHYEMAAHRWRHMYNITVPPTPVCVSVCMCARVRACASACARV